MKKLVVVFLCFFASNAFASKPDSGICPWKLPFTIEVKAVGNDTGWTGFISSGQIQITSRETDSGLKNFTIDIDTLNPHKTFSIQNDSLLYTYTDSSSLTYYGITATIVFFPYEDSILSMQFFITKTTEDSARDSSFVDQYEVQIFSLLYNDSTIFCLDSSYGEHHILVVDHQLTSVFFQYSLVSKSFTASSVTLSGIFRPTTFSDPAATVTETPQPNDLAIYASNGSIACSFEVADHARDLEIFSPLGIREASFTIPSGQTGASLPHLPPGFYFVRLEDAMAKVYIAE